jgi:hypothetical protein
MNQRAKDSCVSVSVREREREKCIVLNSVSSFAALLQSMHHEIILLKVLRKKKE